MLEAEWFSKRGTGLSPESSEPKHLSAYRLDRRLAIALACLCAAVGVFTVYPSARMLMAIWRDDPLKSMGAMVPFVSAAMILRCWRRIDWDMEGSSWGLVLLAASSVVVFLQAQTLFVVLVHKNWLLQLPPLPLVAVLYAASLVLLVGGRKLLREAWFPVLFMWAVIPVPQSFTKRIDLPLQHASATVARGFAHMLGETLTQDKLRLMFTPEFGMFIAPGCNGIRGSITLGMAALVVGYLYRFRWYVLGPVVAGAVLLGYLFNFLRLCLLVVWYKIALPHPWMQAHSKQADYCIGGTLFVLALSLFFMLANRLRQEEPLRTPKSSSAEAFRVPAAFLWRASAVLLLGAIFAADAVHTIHAESLNEAVAEPQPLPEQLGGGRRCALMTTGWTREPSFISGAITFLPIIE